MLSPLHNCWFSGRCPPVLHIRIPKQHAGAERLFPVQLQKFLCFRGNIDDTLQESTVQHADSFCLCHQFHRTGGKPRAQCRGFPKHQQQSAGRFSFRSVLRPRQDFPDVPAGAVSAYAYTEPLPSQAAHPALPIPAA